MKRPRGRPPLEVDGRGTDGRSPEVHISLGPSVHAQVVALAEYRQTSVGAVIRGAVVEYLRGRRSAPPPVVAPPIAAAPVAPRFSRRVVRDGV